MPRPKTARMVLKLKPQEQVIVNVGDEVKPGQAIVRRKESYEIDEFNLGNELKINPKNLKNYLKAKPKTRVAVGDVLAKKRGFLFEQVIRAPVAGTFDIVDETSGLIGIYRALEESGKLRSWFWGKVDQVDKNKIVFTNKGEVFTAKTGEGEAVVGKIRFIGTGTQFYNLSADIEQCILVIPQARESVIAKADALGAVAVVAQRLTQPPFRLPYLQMDDVENLRAFDGRQAIVFGNKQVLLVMDVGA